MLQIAPNKIPASGTCIILSTEKKITFRRDLRLLTTENINKILEDVFRREYMKRF